MLKLRDSPFQLGAGGTCLVLLLRHLGDAVIASGFVNALHANCSGMAVDILGRGNLREVSESFTAFREYISIDVPLFGHHRRDAAAIKAAYRTMHLVRKRKYDVCINLIGDVRENLITRMTDAKVTIAPRWEPGHLFKHKITDRGAAHLVSCGVAIPSKYSSYYDSMQYFANQLGMSGMVWARRPSRIDLPKETRNIALHPGASHPSRHWPGDKWKALIHELHRRRYQMTLLGSASERFTLLEIFGAEIAGCNLSVVTDEIPHFMGCLASADVLIGMDSFSVHAAYALGVPAVVLNGSADPRIMTPPGNPVVSAGHMCKRYPCYYEFPCQGTDTEYICVRGIEIETVLGALETIVSRNRGAYVT